MAAERASILLAAGADLAKTTTGAARRRHPEGSGESAMVAILEAAAARSVDAGR